MKPNKSSQSIKVVFEHAQKQRNSVGISCSQNPKDFVESSISDISVIKGAK